MAGLPVEEFPRQYARTRGFSLGVPRSFTVAPDGSRVAFLRTRSGDDPVTCLWVLDLGTREERVVFDPREAHALEDEAQLSEAERARRERARERAGGVTQYATDHDVRSGVFGAGGRLFLVDLVDGTARELTSPGPVDDPRLDPTGQRIAFVVDGALHVREIGGGDRVLAKDEDPDVRWGLAEFAAAEEMDRKRGSWWSPDGRSLLAARVDERPVEVWHIVDQRDPSSPVRTTRFPRAGTADAIVTLHRFDVEDGASVEVAWDREAFPYLARVDWSESGPPLIEVVSRDQGTAHVLELDPATGLTSLVREHRDDAWVDLFEGVPARLDDGRVVEVLADREADTYRLTIDGEPVTPTGLQVRGVLDVGSAVLFRASEEPTEIHLWRWSPTGLERLTDEPGVHSGTTGGDVTVVVSATVAEPLPIVRIGDISVPVHAESPVLTAEPTFISLGERRLRAALLLPNGAEPDRRLPVLLDPYGFPQGARVLRAAWSPHLTSQWFADQGFAVLVVDGRGVDGRGPAWDRTIKFDFGLVLDDQVDALHAAAERYSFLDLSRVGIRGWSGGGYLSAMAVLRRPDVFHAAVIGAPVTDFHLYDTYYTERFLGHPDEHPDAYERNSLLVDAAKLERPVLLIHGLADDNVYVANTLRLAEALFEAGRPYELVLIPDATHFTRREAVTENLLRVQADFLRRHLD
ncbi:MAG TPA: prolyl oligopeptidase family serine peptidase [Actinomycetota bacterium]|nr:prolyl oligopeptidase family serine peptidase [Actinomycetota bacterium]